MKKVTFYHLYTLATDKGYFWATTIVFYSVHYSETNPAVFYKELCLVDQWLRTKHGYYIFISRRLDRIIDADFSYQMQDMFTVLGTPEQYWYTYEEALLAGVMEALNKIIHP